MSSEDSICEETEQQKNWFALINAKFKKFDEFHSRKGQQVFDKEIIKPQQQIIEVKELVDFKEDVVIMTIPGNFDRMKERLKLALPHTYQWLYQK